MSIAPSLSGIPKVLIKSVVALVVIAAFATAFLVIRGRAAGTISLTLFGVAYTQDFDTLASSGTSSTVPTGWDFSEAGTNANTLYTAGTGSGNTGDTYSFGASASTERAFGGLQSGALIPTIGASFANNTGGAIGSLAISYTGEQWRLGALARTDQLDFQFSTDAASLTTGNWTDVDALDFTAPVTAGTVGLLDGNAAANRAAVSGSITGLSITNGSTFWIRWTDFNATDADDGLAVDDFSLTPTATGQTYTWVGPTGGIDLYTLAANWSPERLVPNSADVLIVNGNTTPAPAISGVPTETIGQLQIINGAMVTMSTAAPNTLTIAGGTGTDFVPIELVSMTLAGTNPITISLGSGATGSVSGAMIVRDAAHKLLTADPGAIRFNSGAIFTTTTGFSGNPFGSNNSSPIAGIVFASSSFYNHHTGDDPFGSGIFEAVHFDPGSTVTFFTNSGFSSEGRTYGNLTFDGSQGYSHSGTIALTVQDTLTIEAGSTLNHANSSALGISAGALTVKGTFAQGGTFTSNLTVGPILVFTGARWTGSGSGTNTLGGDVSNSGEIRLNGGTSTCDETDTILLRSSVGGVQRTWSDSGVFEFVDVDVKDQKAAIGAGGTTAAIALSSTDSVGNTNWTFQACGPTVAKLASFAANRYEDGSIVLDWQTGLEVDNLGYNLYREEGGKRTRINSHMIAGSALLAGPGVSLMAGRSYAWPDELQKEKDARYWLEELDLNGASTWHGPFSITNAQTGLRPPSPIRGRAMLLSEVGANGPARTIPLPRAAQMTALTAGQFELAGRHALKLSVNREGWYRVAAAELIAAGLDPNIDPRMLQLVADGKEQSFMVRGEEDGRLDAADAIEFYGLGLDRSVTDTRVYWLVAGPQPGRRIEYAKGKGSNGAAASFPYTVERRDRTVYFSSLLNGDEENFFGAVLAGNSIDQSINVQHLYEGSSGAASLKVALQGVTARLHVVKVEVNGAPAGEVRFESQREGVANFSLSRGALKEGPNIVRLTASGGSDISLVDYIRITYPHAFTADNNALRFSLASRHQVMIDGFGSDAIRVMDITDPDSVRELPARVDGRDGQYSVTVNTPKKGGERLLWAFADETSNRPLAIAANQPSSLMEPGQDADFVIITHRDFRESVKPLQSLRERQGLRVRVIDVEDVFDEFSYGEKSPQAIKDFLSFARTGWDEARFVLLVGDASYDPKDYLGAGNWDLVPTKLIDTAFMETASDDWFADFDGDGLPEMAVGRLPVRTVQEASAVVSKIIRYDQSIPSKSVLLVADSNDGFDFEAATSALRALIPGSLTVAEIDRGRHDDDAARSQLLDAINRGQKIVNYSGHGNADQWRGKLLTSSDGSSLLNSEGLSLFVSMTCLNGYFQDPARPSLGESLLSSPGGGAVAVWASSGLCQPAGQTIANQALYRALLSGEETTLGEAAVKSKAAVTDPDIRRTWILLGDPTTKLR